MRVTISILLVLCLVHSSMAIDFGFKVPRGKKECFTEPLNPNTLVKATVQAEEPDYDGLAVTVYDSAGTSLYAEPLTGAHIKFSYTTTTEGNTNICVQNTGKKYIKVFFEMLTGAEAGDITEAASDNDLKPVERQLISMDRLLNSIRTTTSFIVSREEEKLTEADTITFKLYVFSAITIITMAALSFFQVRYLEKFFRAKKLI